MIQIQIPKELILKNVSLAVESASAAQKRVVELGYNVGSGANTARNLGDRPANHATPVIANAVKGLAKDIGGFSVEILKKDMKNLAWAVYCQFQEAVLNQLNW